MEILKAIITIVVLSAGIIVLASILLANTLDNNDKQ